MPENNNQNGKRSKRRNSRRATSSAKPAGSSPKPTDELSSRRQGRRSPGTRIVEFDRQGNPIGDLVARRKGRVAMVKAQLKDELAQQNPELKEPELEELAEEAYDRDFPAADAKLAREYLLTKPVSYTPKSRDIEPVAETHAIRQTDEWFEVEEMLRTYTQMGRPTDRKLPVAAYGCNVLERGKPQVLTHHKAFQVKDDPLAWSYGWPAAFGSNRDLSNVYRSLHSVLQGVNPEVLLELNVRAFIKLRDIIGDPDIGRYLTIDGTAITVPKEQLGSSSKDSREEALRRGQFMDSGFGTHNGYSYWRGFILVFITDIKTTLPLGMALLPANDDEWRCIDGLLKSIHRYWLKYAGETWEPEYMSGDGHFNNDETNRLLEECYGIHPVFPEPSVIGHEHEWHDNHGIPCCALHGDMKLRQSEGFMNHRDRREAGLQPGERADLSAARLRWFCAEEHPELNGPLTHSTRWDAQPRLHPFLPYAGEHKNRIHKRKALELRRNASECMNARLKNRGIGDDDMNKPRWVKTTPEMKWLCYGTALTFTLQRLVHANGLYDASLGEAEADGLLVPCEPTAAQEARENQRRAEQLDRLRNKSIPLDRLPMEWIPTAVAA